MKRKDDIHEKKHPSRIGFGSCNSQELDQPLWPILSSRNISAFVWGGDAIYADTFTKKFGGLIKRRECATVESLRGFYEEQFTHPGYQDFLFHSPNNKNITVFGTIDDHDYGCNNGDSTFQYSKESGLAFLNFTNEPINSPIYKRAKKGLGVYGVKVFDFDRPKGSHLVPDEEAAVDPDVKEILVNRSPTYSKKSVAIFVLDVRTNKTPWSSGMDRFKPNKEGDFLGGEQWQWFEKALSHSKATVNIIVQGLQVHPERHPDSEIVETWDKFPTAQQRLYDTILHSRVEAPFLISGDVHMAQLLRKDCLKPRDSLPLSSSSAKYRTLMELTTSGMTHSWGTCFIPRRHYHTSWYGPYAHFVSKSIMSFLHFVIPMPDLVISHYYNNDENGMPPFQLKYQGSFLEHGGAEGSKQGKQFTLDLNFAELEFDWDRKELIGRVFGVNLSDPPLLSARWSFDQLSGRSAFPPNSFDSSIDEWEKHFALVKDGRWMCTPVGGIANDYQVLFGQTLGIIFTTMIVSFPLFLTYFISTFILSRIFMCNRWNQRSKHNMQKKKN